MEDKQNFFKWREEKNTKAILKLVKKHMLVMSTIAKGTF